MSAVGSAAKRLLERAPKAVRTFKSSASQQSGGHGHSTGVGKPLSFAIQYSDWRFEGPVVFKLLMLHVPVQGYDDYIHAEHMYSMQKVTVARLCSPY